MGVSVREKPKNSGYWWLFIRHQGQRVCQFVSQNKEIADDAAADIRKEIRTGKFDLEALKASRIPKEEEPPTPELPTLKEYYARFERDLKLTVAESTAHLYAYVFNRHLLPALIPENPDLSDSQRLPLGDFRLDKIERAHLKILVASLMAKKCSRIVNEKVKAADGTESTRKKTIHFNLSKPSLRIILSALTTCLTNAQREDGLIPANPALSLGKFIKQAKRRHESIDPFEPQEVPIFLQSVQKTAPDFLTMFIVLLHTGIRAGECGGLQWPDVDFRNRYLLVQRTRTPKGRLQPQKNGKTRKVDLSDAAIAALQSHRRELQKIYLKKGAPLPEWVFPNREGKPHNMTNVRNRIFYRACEKAGLHRRPLHSTRHTFATLLLQQGESPVYVKEQMGHSSITVTVDSTSIGFRAPTAMPSIDFPLSAPSPILRKLAPLTESQISPRMKRKCMSRIWDRIKGSQNLRNRHILVIRHTQDKRYELSMEEYDRLLVSSNAVKFQHSQRRVGHRFHS